MAGMTPVTHPLTISQQIFQPRFRDGMKDPFWDYKKVFSLQDSKWATEQTFGTSVLGPASASDIWGTVNFLDLVEFSKTVWTHVTYTLGGMVPQQLIEDSRYTDFTKELGFGIGQGQEYVRGYAASLIFSRAFDSATQPMWDTTSAGAAVPLCGTHTLQVSGGSLVNAFTAKSLNWANLWDVCMYFQQTLVDHAGLPLTDDPKTIVAHTSKIPNIMRALQDTWQPDTGNRNTQTLTEKFKLDFVTCRTLASQSYWFVLGSKFQADNIFYTRVSPTVDQETMKGQGRYGIMFTSRQRFSCGPRNFPYIAGVSS